MDLDIEHLNVILSEKEIIKDMTLRVSNGDFVGLIGPNGCGKTTLLKTVYKALKPKSGKVWLGSLDVLNSRPKTLAKQMSVVRQFNDINFDFSVLQIVLMGRFPHKKSHFQGNSEQDMKIARDALHAVGMGEYADRSYSSLSGGEQQRVILARAIAQSPKFMLLDEPTNHLDIKYQLQIMSSVKNLGIGVLAALHDLNLAALFCSYLYLMNEGQIAQAGQPEEVLTEENIQNIYQVKCKIHSDEESGKLFITFLP